MRSALETLLTTDDDLMTILTGGLYARQEIDRTKTPDAFDNFKEVKPCATLMMNTRVPIDPHSPATFADQFFKLYFYQQIGYDQIDLAMERVFDLLNKQKVTSSQGYCYEIVHVGDLGDSEDPALLVPMNYSRYQAKLLRRV